MGMVVGGLHTGPAAGVPATERVSGQNTLGTGPVERAVGCWNAHHSLRCANIQHTLHWDGMGSQPSEQCPPNMMTSSSWHGPNVPEGSGRDSGGSPGKLAWNK